MFLEIIEKISDEIIKNEEYLTELDREIGDGDHGVNLARGFTEIKNQLANFKDLPVSDVFTKMGMILLTKVGGASGAIYGTAFMVYNCFYKRAKSENETELCSGKKKYKYVHKKNSAACTAEQEGIYTGFPDI